MCLTANTHAGPTSDHVPQHRISIASTGTRSARSAPPPPRRRPPQCPRAKHSPAGCPDDAAVDVSRPTRSWCRATMSRNLGHADDRRRLGLRSPASSLRRSGGSRAAGADDADRTAPSACTPGHHRSRRCPLAPWTGYVFAPGPWGRVVKGGAWLEIDGSVVGWSTAALTPYSAGQPDLVCFSEVPRRHRLGPSHTRRRRWQSGAACQLSGLAGGRGSTTTDHYHHGRRDGERSLRRLVGHHRLALSPSSSIRGGTGYAWPPSGRHRWKCRGASRLLRRVGAGRQPPRQGVGVRGQPGSQRGRARTVCHRGRRRGRYGAGDQQVRGAHGPRRPPDEPLAPPRPWLRPRRTSSACGPTAHRAGDRAPRPRSSVNRPAPGPWSSRRR